MLSPAYVLLAVLVVACGACVAYWIGRMHGFDEGRAARQGFAERNRFARHDDDHPDEIERASALPHVVGRPYANRYDGMTDNTH